MILAQPCIFRIRRILLLIRAVAVVLMRSPSEIHPNDAPASHDGRSSRSSDGSVDGDRVVEQLVTEFVIDQHDGNAPRAPAHIHCVLDLPDSEGLIGSHWANLHRRGP
jgi:hypothetical protein